MNHFHIAGSFEYINIYSTVCSFALEKLHTKKHKAYLPYLPVVGHMALFYL